MKDARRGTTRTNAAAEGSKPRAPGRTTLTERIEEQPVVQRRNGASAAPTPRQAERAARGTEGGGGSLPFLDLLQDAFGSHDLSGITAHQGPAASRAAHELGGAAYAYGDRVVFGETPDLATAAHEATHVLQQRRGVQLDGGIDKPGDAHEQQANAVADAVVAGRSAAPILDQLGKGTGATTPAIQRQDGTPPPRTYVDPATAIPEQTQCEMVGTIQHRPLQIVIDQPTAEALWSQLSEEPEPYIEREIARMNEILASSGVNAVVTLARVVYVTDTTEEAMGALGWGHGGTGTWRMVNDSAPAGSDFFNADQALDYGLIHEWGHSVFGFWDDYGLDYSSSETDQLTPGAERVRHHGPEGLMNQPDEQNPDEIMISDWQVQQVNDSIARGEGYVGIMRIRPEDVATTATLTFANSVEPYVSGGSAQLYRSVPVDSGTKDKDGKTIYTKTMQAVGTPVIVSGRGVPVADVHALFTELLADDVTGYDQAWMTYTGPGTLMVEVQTSTGPYYFGTDISEFVGRGDAVTVVVHMQ